MTTKKKFPVSHKIIATACGFGFFPYGPGTMGAVFAVLIWLPLFLWCPYDVWIGVTIGLTLLFTAVWWQPVVAFILFRFYDIAKPFGVRQMEKLPGGIGIMADDVLAGIYGAITLIIINWLFV